MEEFSVLDNHLFGSKEGETNLKLLMEKFAAFSKRVGKVNALKTNYFRINPDENRENDNKK